MSAMEKAYTPQKIEREIYDLWLRKGAFSPKKGEGYHSIVIPPPNVTGALHLGHSLNNSIQDFATRWARLKGYETVWVPGTDHAGIATQNVVEKHLAEKGLTRHQLGRKKFLQEVWKWKEVYQEQIRRQLQALGFSCDWERERFTLDAQYSDSVLYAFLCLAEEGLIYRGRRIIHWCPRCLTALSDIEVNYHEVEGKLYYVRYPLEEGGSITVATTRPETILGDVAIAVHPDDERFAGVVGKMALLPIPGIKRKLPIITDTAVEISFGSGALKITPSHDPVDFEVAQRHNLPPLEALDEEARIAEGFGPYSGKDRFVARNMVVEALHQAGFLESIQPYTHSVGHCSRCHTMVEPRLSVQWFVKMQPLAEKAIEAFRKEGKPVFYPESWGNVYLSWLENIRDWCISRQLWWGHRLPIWYCVSCNKEVVKVHRSGEPYSVLHPLHEVPEEEVDRLIFTGEPVFETAYKPEKCSRCGNPHLIQDTDVLDTWFSSALWPMAVFGWPQDTPDFRRFYPTTVLVTGFDILFFWVARMVMMGLFFTNKVPFHSVYIHGLIRDIEGRKMTKSLGNVIDPMDVVRDFGADALRFAFAYALSKGQDIRLSEDKLDGARKFLNKIWNAARLLLITVPEGWKFDWEHTPEPKHPVDRWLFSLLKKTLEQVEKDYETYDYRPVAQHLYDFFWSDYCDWYLEALKSRLYKNQKQKEEALQQALTAFSYLLHALHPIIPFLTEALWQQFPLAHKGLIADFRWRCPPWNFPEEEKWFENIREVSRVIRALKRDLDMPFTEKTSVAILPSLEEQEKELVEKLAFVEVKSDRPSQEQFLEERVHRWQIIFPVLDKEYVQKKLQEVSELLRKIEERREKLEKILGNEKFLSSAPAHIQENYREQLQAVKEEEEEMKRKWQRLSSALK
ncbi:MAG: valine--tRNA ligase [bacterium JZ-2024 1]